MKRIVVTGVFAAAAAVLASAVLADPTPVTPKAGSTVASSHPTFRWKLGTAEVAESVSISDSPKLGSTGDFAQLVDADILAADATSWTPSKALAAGSYWWHVASHDTRAATGHLFSPAVPFTVKTLLSVDSISVETAGSQFLAIVKVKANVRNVNVSETIFRGTKKLMTRKAVTDNFLIDNATQDQWVSNLPPSVKHGTSLKLVVVLSVKGSTAKLTKSKTFRA